MFLEPLSVILVSGRLLDNCLLHPKTSRLTVLAGTVLTPLSWPGREGENKLSRYESMWSTLSLLMFNKI